MKLKALLASALLMGLLTGCGGNDEAGEEEEKAAENTESTEEQNEQMDQNEENAGETEEEENTDVVTTASIVNNAEALKAAASEDGTWLFAILNDVQMEEELVVAGEFHDKDDPEKDIYRKFAPYAQDENRNVTARYTLTVPKMTVQSPNFKIQAGVVKGDVYVEANGFTLTDDADIEGNIYFASEEFKNSATIEGQVSGEQAVQ